ncbi:hypothetical protein [Dehalogenimonas etheniformans]|uniref:hypothetical protein n=1 Tax=Dehalogenimonas etheniformans TaxID=1536648 RepID=UPI001F34EDF5|nr:hypothetical protein [Dehalogenimonas etheniformans]
MPRSFPKVQAGKTQHDQSERAGPDEILLKNAVHPEQPNGAVLVEGPGQKSDHGDGTSQRREKEIGLFHRPILKITTGSSNGSD